MWNRFLHHLFPHSYISFVCLSVFWEIVAIVSIQLRDIALRTTQRAQCVICQYVFIACAAANQINQLYAAIFTP